MLLLLPERWICSQKRIGAYMLGSINGGHGWIWLSNEDEGWYEKGYGDEIDGGFSV
jgi:hypothetical protein